MPATRTTPSDIGTPLTQTSLMTGLRDAMTAIFGVNPTKSYTVGTDQFSLWEIVGDTSKAFGRCFYRLRVSSGLVVSHAIGSAFTDSTNTLVNASAESHSTTYVANTPVKMFGFSNPEYRFLISTQGTTQQLLGLFRPANAPSFDEGSFPKFFIATSGDLTGVSCTGLSPYGSTLTFTTILGLTQMGGADAYLQTRSAMQGIVIWAPSNTGILAQTTDELALGACTGLARGDTFYDPNDVNRQYFVSRGAAGALLLRI